MAVPKTRKYIVDIVGGLPVILMDLNLTDSSLKKKYIYANSQLLAQHYGDSTATRFLYLHDRLGSVRQIIYTNGSVTKYYTYEPFGETIESGGYIVNPFMFTGQWFDSELDDYYLRARQYNPHISRFTTRDPVAGKFEEPLTLHKYLYCGNDPLNRIDPAGLWASYVTLTAMGSFGPSRVAQFGVVWDEQGNTALMSIKGIGGGSPILSAGVSFGLYPWAKSIDDVSGVSGTFGGSVGPHGGEIMVGGGLRNLGFEYTFSVAAFPAFIPAEIHGHVTSTEVDREALAALVESFEEGLYEVNTLAEGYAYLTVQALLYELYGRDVMPKKP